MKLLIVDDEERIRNGMAHFVKNNVGAFDEILLAESGEQALGIIREQHPEVLISDIVMPGMGGIAFIEEAVRFFSQLRVIMISGHSDLQYFKAALRMDVVDYVLKPVDLDELLRVIEKAVRSWNQMENDRTEKERLSRRLSECLGSLRCELCRELLSGKITDRASLSQKAQEMNTLLSESCVMRVLEISTEQISKISASESMRRTVQESLAAYAQRELEEKGRGLFCPREDYRITAVLFSENSDEGDAFTRDFLRALFSYMKETFEVRAFAGASEWAYETNEIPALSEQAETALCRASFFANEQLCIYSGNGLVSDSENPVFGEISKTTLREISGGDFRGVKAILDSGFVTLKGLSRVTEQKILSIKIELANLFTGMVQAMMIPEEKSFSHRNVVNELMEKTSLSEMEEWASRFFEQLQDRFLQSRKSRVAKIVDETKEIVRKKYAQGINVQSIAQEVGISPNYLSAVFKAESGIGLTEYITTVRLEHAVDLLSNTTYKVKEIAGMIGCEDQNYFAKIFKKQFGVNPTEYRVMK